MRSAGEARSLQMEEWVERMVVERRIAGELHMAEEVVLHTRRELEIRIAPVGEVGHSLPVVEDMPVDRIGLVGVLHMAVAEEVAHRGAAEEDTMADRIALEAAHRKLAVEEDIPEVGIDLGEVDHKLVVRMPAVEEEDTAGKEVEGILFIISACHHQQSHIRTTLRWGSAVRRVSSLVSHVCSCCLNCRICGLMREEEG